MVVAKIGVDQPSSLATEVAVASELWALDAPVVPPAPEVPGVVHALGEFRITFWRYCPQPLEIEISPEQMAAALGALHAGLAQVSSPVKRRLPSYTAELRSVSALLRGAERMPALPEDDRRMLVRVFEHLWGRLQVLSSSGADAVIHGSPHSFNVVLVDRMPRFIDFETTCIGPVEWDLAHMSADVANNYAAVVDPQLLEVCRDLGRVKTAAWCWANEHRGDMRYHADAHLAYLKKSFAEHAE